MGGAGVPFGSLTFANCFFQEVGLEIDANVVNTGFIIGLSVGGALVLCCVVSAVTFFVYALHLADGKPRRRAHPSDLVPPPEQNAQKEVSVQGGACSDPP